MPVAYRDLGPHEQRKRSLERLQQMRSDRSSWDAHAKEISQSLLPRSGRFFSQDRNRGGNRHQNIIDNTGTRALRVMAAGLMAGATSPARPFFRLAAADPDLNRFHPVKLWLDDTALRIRRVLSKSNFYRVAHQIYEEMGAYGTASAYVTPDFDSVVHFAPMTFGEFWLAQDYKQRVTTIYRECDITVGQMVTEFGYENCSITVRNLFDRGQVDSYQTIVHAIEPRTDREHGKADNRNMPWRSVYFELGQDVTQVLREGGFARFPVLAPRWATTPGDVYGHSPAMDALGDIKALQHAQYRKAQAIDYMTAPPLQVPAAMRGRNVETLPRGVTYVDSTGNQNGIRTMWEVQLDLSHMTKDIEDTRDRIRSAFYSDLFLMITGISDTTMRTAAEIAERHEEKLLMLGPTIERLDNEFLDPTINLVFDHMVEAGAVMPPPEEMAGMDINIEYVSMLAQAQRAIGANSTDRFVGNLSALSQLKPETADRLNSDNWVDEYSDMMGVSPKLIVPVDEANALRQKRAAALAAKEQAAAIQQMAATTKDLAASPTAEQSALTDAVGMFSGYQTPGA